MLAVPRRSGVHAVVATAVVDESSEGINIIVRMRRADRTPTGTGVGWRCGLGAANVPI